MKARRAHAAKEPVYAFWDSSAVIPLCGLQRQAAVTRQVARNYRIVVWWGTSVEATSAFHRLKRDGLLTASDITHAFERLNQLRVRWDEISPSEIVRELAERLLARHKLRAADALQLAAAIEWCGNRPRGRVFIGSDGDLMDAAEAEGFSCLQIK